MNCFRRVKAFTRSPGSRESRQRKVLMLSGVAFVLIILLGIYLDPLIYIGIGGIIFVIIIAFTRSLGLRQRKVLIISGVVYFAAIFVLGVLLSPLMFMPIGIIFLTILYIAISSWKNRLEENEEGYDTEQVSELPMSTFSHDDIEQVSGLPMRFSHVELQVATKDFTMLLGKGGFGSVFRGVLADGTTEIAVKRLERMGSEVKGFLEEVKTIGSVHHFNLARLIGFCAENRHRLLVYEYLSNGSLDKWILKRDQNKDLNWETRKKIILDIAKGLAYLHEDCRYKIIHLDIKPHNILLDKNFNAKVSDFGLSKLIERDQRQVLTGSGMGGTPGYVAPDSRVTVKADVYSFGIVLLEIVARRRNVDYSRPSSFNLIQMLQNKGEENQDQLIDIVEHLDEDMENHREEVARTIRIGAWCLQHDHTRRPLMSTVVKALQGDIQVDPNIIYKFTHPTATSFSAANEHIISEAPQASVLSGPR